MQLSKIKLLEILNTPFIDKEIKEIKYQVYTMGKWIKKEDMACSTRNHAEK